MYHAPQGRPGSASVLVVDDHALVRAGLRSLIQATPGLSVVAEAGDVRAALAIAREHAPDVVLLAARAARDADADDLPALRRLAPHTCVLVLGDDGDPADAHARLPNDAGVGELCSAVARLLGSRCHSCVARPYCATPRAAITPRERQVVVGVAAGLSTKQIAADLGVSPRTVDTYRESLARKLGASSVAALTRYAIENDVTDSRASR